MYDLRVSTGKSDVVVIQKPRVFQLFLKDAVIMEALVQFGTPVQAFLDQDVNDHSPQIHARCYPPYFCMAMILDVFAITSMGRLLVLSYSVTI
jgi:hypothetical protein